MEIGWNPASAAQPATRMHHSAQNDCGCPGSGRWFRAPNISMRGRHTLDSECAAMGPTSPESDCDRSREAPVSVRATVTLSAPTVLARGRSIRVRYCVARFGRLVWGATMGTVRGRARSGRLRCEAPAGEVGDARTQVGLTTKGIWRWGMRGSAARARRRRSHATAMKSRRRKAAPPIAPPSSAPRRWLVLFALVARRDPRREEGNGVEAIAGGKVRATDIRDVVGEGGGGGDGGEMGAGTVGQKVTTALASRARHSRSSREHVSSRHWPEEEHPWEKL
ncbi:hypothetical protein B0H17DRAFT_1052239 [Mycena rosella]|uniref:Uncharacterized protein n=1 Tax=Mycena rosella TaxID=1033263 RepID=A0AAD7DR80_MYCRO|nr:hypothetical protein B0H17DRAFT_1052239 [Mycena rosella]